MSNLFSKISVRRILWFSLAILALYVAMLGFQLFRAGLYGYQTRAFLDDWVKKGEVPNERAWNVAVKAATNAVDIFPLANNGEFYDNLGRVYEWKYFDRPFGDELSKDSRNLALEAYRKAIEARPLWPHTYAQKAYVKLRLLQFDEEFEEAFNMTLNLGPWRLPVLSQLAEIALIAWPSLQPQLQNRAFESFRRVAFLSRKTANELSFLAREAGLITEYCSAIKEVTTKQPLELCVEKKL